MNNIFGIIVSILYVGIIIASAKVFEKAGKEGPESPAVEECIEMLNSSGAIEKAKSISRELIETACSEVKSFYQNGEIGALIAELFVSMLI